MSKKYPRTPHLPWSKGKTLDDKTLDSVNHFINQEIIITEKMDGSNMCMTRESLFARSHEAPPTHPSFDYAKRLHAQVKWNIKKGISIFGEYCYAVHSIEYTALPGYFLVFAVRDDENDEWWSWDEVVAEAQRLGLVTVHFLWRGVVKSVEMLKTITEDLANQHSSCGGEREGVVIRIAGRFHDRDFAKSVAKWVREDHVQKDAEHWMKGEIRKNKLKKA